MNKYFFKFNNGSTILIAAGNKLKAVEILAVNYKSLFESTGFTCDMVTAEINEYGEKFE